MFHRIGLTFGILFLFIGIGIIPSIGINVLEKSTISTLDRNTLYVGGSGPGNYTKIQDAIDNASYNDTVFVFKGEYHENIYINTSISLIGEDKSTTIVNADDYRDVINISADGVILTGFSLTESEWAPYFGAGVRIDSSDNNVIYDNIIVNNFGGLYLINSSNNSIHDNSIINNPSRGIKIEHSSYNSIIGNKVINDGGLSADYSHHNLIKNNEFRYGFGGVDFDDSGDTIIDNNFITGIVWPAIELVNSPQAKITNNTIIDNGDYGISLASSSYITINDNIIKNNDRTGVVLRGRGNIVSGNIIEHNGYGYYEAGIFLSGAKDSIVTDNQISNNSNGIYISNDAFNNTITKNTISHNHISGIATYYSENNTLYLNNFIDNEKNTDCAKSKIQWDNGVFGNFWDDYMGYDRDGDGIGDTPKEIEDDENKDSYPLMVPYGPDTAIRITTPLEGYLYLRNIRFLPISSTIVFGNIKIKVSATNYQNDDVEIEKVEFYVDGLHRRTDKRAPYSWRWRLSSHIKHNHTISVIAYDDEGNTAIDECQVWKFF